MWIFLSDAFLSVVWTDECADDELLVRGRRPGDIESVFPKAKVTESTMTDYLYRAAVPRADVAGVLAGQVMKIDYANFKGSMRDDRFHAAAMKVWSAMAALQPTPPHSGRSRFAFDETPASSHRPANKKKPRKLKRGQ